MYSTVETTDDDCQHHTCFDNNDDKNADDDADAENLEMSGSIITSRHPDSLFTVSEIERKRDISVPVY
jgi:hypothetical protein